MSYETNGTVAEQTARVRDERGLFGLRATAAGLGAGAVFLGIAAALHPMGTHTDIEQTKGVITGYEKLDQTIVAGVNVQTSSKTTISSTIFGKSVPGLNIQQSIDAQVDANVCQNNVDVRYSYNPATKTTRVKVPAKAICYIMVMPPEHYKPSSVRAGLAAMPSETVIQIFENLGMDKNSPRDAIAQKLTQYNNVSNLDEAYKCMPTAFESFTRQRFIAVNKQLFRHIGADIAKQGADYDPDKVEVDIPKTIQTPDNKYSDMLKGYDAKKGVDVKPASVDPAKDCIESDAARLQADKLLKEPTDG